MSDLTVLFVIIGYVLMGLFTNAFVEEIWDNSEIDFPVFVIVLLFWPIVIVTLIVGALVLWIPIYSLFQKIAKAIVGWFRNKLKKREEKENG